MGLQAEVKPQRLWRTSCLLVLKAHNDDHMTGQDEAATLQCYVSHLRGSGQRVTPFPQSGTSDKFLGVVFLDMIFYAHVPLSLQFIPINEGPYHFYAQE